MTPCVSVHTTCPARETAAALGRQAVEAGLAACAQLTGPIRSFYRWKGDIEIAEEWRCTLKTTRERWPDVAAFIRSSHVYELPEITVEALDGTAEYLAWVTDAVRPAAVPPLSGGDR